MNTSPSEAILLKISAILHYLIGRSEAAFNLLKLLCTGRHNQ